MGVAAGTIQDLCCRVNKENQARALLSHVIITTGASWEPVDSVRRLTNFSTGRTGTILAETYLAAGWAVSLLRSETATAPPPSAMDRLRLESFGTLASLETALQRAAADFRRPVHAVLHAAALSDFVVQRITVGGADAQPGDGKIPSRAGGVRLDLAPAPKLIHQLRTLFPNAWIAGWKYETSGTQSEAIDAARRQLVESRTDACVLNGSAVGIGYFIVDHAGAAPTPIRTTDELADALRRLSPARNPAPGRNA